MLKKFIVLVVYIFAGGTLAAAQLRAGANPVPAIIVIRDDAGRKVSIKIPVKRIVTLAPSNTQIVSALGMTSTIAGASNTDDNPLPEHVKRIGFVNPSIEEIVALRPELVMGIYGQDMVCNRLERLKIPCIILSPSNIEGVMQDISFAGRMLSTNAMASMIINNMRQKIDLIGAMLSRCKTKPLVYFEIEGSDPSRPFSAGKGSFIDSMITMSHAINMAHNTVTMWPQLSQEYIISKNPDVIIMSDRLDINALKKRPGWPEIKAIKNNRVYHVDANLVSRPGPDIVNAFIQIARDIHPEVFENNNSGTDKSPLPPFTKGGGGGINMQSPGGTNNQ